MVALHTNDARSNGSPLDSAAGAAGPQATEAFEQLGNETRLAILLALWEGYGTVIWHRAYVEDVAEAIRIVPERGTPGEAYNVADRTVCTIGDVIELIADALDTSVEVIHASDRELAQVGLESGAFVLYHHPTSTYPHVLDTCKIASLGWSSTPVEVTTERTVTESLASGRDGSEFDPGRAAEERLIGLLE